jgi:uncharacterized phage-associated protein
MFDQAKTMAALAYLFRETRESMYPVLKMLYLADKLHLARWGRYIGHDDYCAMSQGPVPSYAYDLLKSVRGEAVRRQMDVAAAKRAFRYEGDHRFTVAVDVDLDDLSESDLAALDDVVSTYRIYGSKGIRELSHDDAWQTAWSGATRLFRKSVPLNVVAVAKAGDAPSWVFEHLKDTAPGEAELVRA